MRPVLWSVMGQCPMLMNCWMVSAVNMMVQMGCLWLTAWLFRFPLWQHGLKPGIMQSTVPNTSAHNGYAVQECYASMMLYHDPSMLPVIWLVIWGVVGMPLVLETWLVDAYSLKVGMAIFFGMALQMTIPLLAAWLVVKVLGARHESNLFRIFCKY